jgi:hypothetical protein
MDIPRQSRRFNHSPFVTDLSLPAMWLWFVGLGTDWAKTGLLFSHLSFLKIPHRRVGIESSGGEGGLVDAGQR